MDPWPFIYTNSGGQAANEAYVHQSQQSWAPGFSDDVSQAIAVSQAEKQLLMQAFARPFGEHHLTPLFIPGHHAPLEVVTSPTVLRGRHISISSNADATFVFDAAEIGDIASEGEEEQVVIMEEAVTSPTARPPELRRRNSWGSERDLTHMRQNNSADDFELLLSTAPTSLQMEPWRAFHEERISPSSKWVYCMHENGAILKVQVMAGMTGKFAVLEGHEAVETWRRLRGVANFERYFPQDLRMGTRDPLFVKAEQQYQLCCGRWPFLPQECWKHALAFLDGSSLARASMSCHMLGTTSEHSKVRESLVKQVAKQLLATYLSPSQGATILKPETDPSQVLAYLHQNCRQMQDTSAPMHGTFGRTYMNRWSGPANFQHELLNISLLESLALWDGDMQSLIMPEELSIKPQEELDMVPIGGHLFKLATTRRTLRAVVNDLDNAGLAGHVLHLKCRIFIITTAQLQQLIQQDGWEEMRHILATEYESPPAVPQPVPASTPSLWVLYFTPRQPGYYTWM